MNFKFELEAEVTITQSVRYKAADGRCVENWWTETALEPIS